jgi:hypothetical protein
MKRTTATEKTELPRTYVMGAKDYEFDSSIAGVRWWIEDGVSGPYVAYEFVRKTDNSLDLPEPI